MSFLYLGEVPCHPLHHHSLLITRSSGYLAVLLQYTPAPPTPATRPRKLHICFSLSHQERCRRLAGWPVHAELALLVDEELLELADLLGQHLGCHRQAPDHAEPAAVGHSRGQLAVRHAVHAGQDDGRVDAQQARQRLVQRRFRE